MIVWPNLVSVVGVGVGVGDDDVAAAEVVIFADANIFVAVPYSSELETAEFAVYAAAELLASANER